MSRRPSWTTKAIADPPKPVEPEHSAVAVLDEEWEVPSAKSSEANLVSQKLTATLPNEWGSADEWKTRTVTLPDGRTESAILRVSCCPADRTIDEWCDEMDTALMDRYERRAFLARKATT